MKTAMQKFKQDIEVERLWMLTINGKSFFFNMFPFSLLIVFGLWDEHSHLQLILWFVAFNLMNLVKWQLLTSARFRNKEILADHIPKFRWILLILGMLTGLAWALCIVLFLNPADPANVLIISIPAIIQAVGAMTTWFASLSAVLSIALTPSLALMVAFIARGELDYFITGLFVAVLPALTFYYARNLQEIVNRSLLLSFENAALRRDFEEKSLLLETALENMDQGISMCDSHDRLRMWNSHFTDLLGQTGALVSADVDLTEILDSAALPIPNLNDGEFEYRLPDGRVYEIRQTRLNTGGRVLTYTDISKLIKREEALESAKKEAEQANAAKTRFLAAASHDLRQPIHALGLFFAELSDRVKNNETETVIGQIEDSIEAIISMLNALLDVSKLDAGILKPALENFNLQDLFERLKIEFQAVALENGNRLAVRPTRARIHTDPAMLERMLRNLIGNALRYTKEGKVLMAARQRNKHLEINIFDTGPGIPEDKLDEIFVEFHQLHNQARDRRQGLGLGLAIVKRLVKLLEYRISVRSVFGKGSCFTLTLPMTPSGDSGSTKRAAELKPFIDCSFSGRTILVLDDDISVINGMKGLLWRWGCHPLTANSSEQAMNTIAQLRGTLDLFIVDYRLPDNVSGIDVAIAVQDRLGYRVPVLIITGDTGPDRLKEADASGFPLLHKPVQPSKLRSTLQYLLALKQT